MSDAPSTASASSAPVSALASPRSNTTAAAGAAGSTSTLPAPSRPAPRRPDGIGSSGSSSSPRSAVVSASNSSGSSVQVANASTVSTTGPSVLSPRGVTAASAPASSIAQRSAAFGGSALKPAAAATATAVTVPARALPVNSAPVVVPSPSAPSQQSSATPGSVKLPAFMLFCNMRRAEVVRHNPGVLPTALLKLMEDMWSAMTPEERAPYEELATVGFSPTAITDQSVPASSSTGGSARATAPDTTPAGAAAAGGASSSLQQRAPSTEAPVSTVSSAAPASVTPTGVTAVKSDAVSSAPVALPVTGVSSASVTAPPPGKVRVQDPYQHFCSARRPVLMAERPDISVRDVITTLADEWRDMSADQRVVYTYKDAPVTSSPPVPAAASVLSPRGTSATIAALSAAIVSPRAVTPTTQSASAVGATGAAASVINSPFLSQDAAAVRASRGQSAAVNPSSLASPPAPTRTAPGVPAHSAVSTTSSSSTQPPSSTTDLTPSDSQPLTAAQQQRNQELAGVAVRALNLALGHTSSSTQDSAPSSSASSISAANPAASSVSKLASPRSTGHHHIPHANTLRGTDATALNHQGASDSPSGNPTTAALLSPRARFATQADAAVAPAVTVRPTKTAIHSAAASAHAYVHGAAAVLPAVATGGGTTIKPAIPAPTGVAPRLPAPSQPAPSVPAPDRPPPPLPAPAYDPPPPEQTSNRDRMVSLDSMDGDDGNRDSMDTDDVDGSRRSPGLPPLPAQLGLSEPPASSLSLVDDANADPGSMTNSAYGHHHYAMSDPFSGTREQSESVSSVSFMSPSGHRGGARSPSQDARSAATSVTGGRGTSPTGRNHEVAGGAAGTVLRQGWLTKRGDKFHSWKKRYFVLKTGLLAYYSSQEDQKPISVLSMIGASCQEVPYDKYSRHNCFEVLLPHTDRRYVMMAASPEERSDWVQAFNQHTLSMRKLRSAHSNLNVSTDASAAASRDGKAGADGAPEKPISGGGIPGVLAHITHARNKPAGPFGGQAYTEYNIVVRSGKLSWSVQKRYTQFKALHRILFPRYNYLFLTDAAPFPPPEFPPKTYAVKSSLDRAVVESRIVLFDRYLKTLLAVPELAAGVELMEFLGLIKVSASSAVSMGDQIQRAQSAETRRRRSAQRHAHAAASGGRAKSPPPAGAARRRAHSVHHENIMGFCDIGDILLMRSNTTFSSVTRTITRSEWDHVGIITREPMFSKKPQSLCVLEAVNSGVLLTPLEGRLISSQSANQAVAIRKLRWTSHPEALQALLEFQEEVVGKRYSLKGLVLSRDLSEKHDSYFCSELVAACYQVMGLIPDTKLPVLLPGDFAYSTPSAQELATLHQIVRNGALSAGQDDGSQIAKLLRFRGHLFNYLEPEAFVSFERESLADAVMFDMPAAIRDPTGKVAADDGKAAAASSSLQPKRALAGAPGKFSAFSLPGAVPHVPITDAPSAPVSASSSTQALPNVSSSSSLAVPSMQHHPRSKSSADEDGDLQSLGRSDSDVAFRMAPPPNQPPPAPPRMLMSPDRAAVRTRNARDVNAASAGDAMDPAVESDASGSDGDASSETDDEAMRMQSLLSGGEEEDSDGDDRDESSVIRVPTDRDAVKAAAVDAAKPAGAPWQRKFSASSVVSVDSVSSAGTDAHGSRAQKDVVSPGDKSSRKLRALLGIAADSNVPTEDVKPPGRAKSPVIGLKSAASAEYKPRPASSKKLAALLGENQPTGAAPLPVDTTPWDAPTSTSPPPMRSSLLSAAGSAVIHHDSMSSGAADHRPKVASGRKLAAMLGHNAFLSKYQVDGPVAGGVASTASMPSLPVRATSPPPVPLSQAGSRVASVQALPPLGSSASGDAEFSAVISSPDPLVIRPGHFGPSASATSSSSNLSFKGDPTSPPTAEPRTLGTSKKAAALLGLSGPH